jgi:predicted phage terminase large subunit-like protein
MKLTLNGKPIEVSEQEYQVLLRTQLYSFIERSFYELNPQTKFMRNWHIEEIAQALEDCLLGKTKRLIINVPPRSLKSHCVSIAMPAWILGHNPSAQIICVSYGQDLANTLAGNCRSLMSSAWYRNLMPTRLATKRQATNDFYTTEQGFRMATSVGGVLTGRGADFLLIDDPLKPEEALSDTQRKTVNDWYEHTLMTRLNNKRDGCIIIVMQRLHEDDLVGHVLKSGDWTVLRFPAIAEEDETHFIRSLGKIRIVRRLAGQALHPEREPIDILDGLRDRLGEFNFSGQYQQAPAPLGGGMIKIAWFRHYQTPPLSFDLIFQSWDTANKTTQLSDYSVCTTWGVIGKQLYLLHVFRKRIGFPELKRAVRDQRQAFGAQVVLIEDKASGTALIQELINEGQYGIVSYKTTMNKEMRMHSVTSTIENGMAHLPEQADWLEVFLHELATFPRSKYDDQADSVSQALDWIRQKNAIPTVQFSTVYL